MKASTVYAKAARQVETRKDLPSCWAIQRVRGNRAQLKQYQDFMLGGEMDVTTLWGRGNEYSTETNETRVLLLCFMAAIADSRR